MFKSISLRKKEIENNTAPNYKTSNIKKNIESNVGDSAEIKKSREIILQTKLIVVELFQVF